MRTISVIIATYNRSQALAEALKSLLAQERDRSFDFDVIVVDNNSTDKTRETAEAMACGKPVIGTDIDGIPEVIGNNESGMLLNPRTPEQLAKLIINFIENPEAAKKRGLQGRKRVLENFNVYKNIQRIHHIYQEALDERK